MILGISENSKAKTSDGVAGGFDVLADFLKESQQQKYRLKKSNLNFHNMISFDKAATKSAGGAGNYKKN